MNAQQEIHVTAFLVKSVADMGVNKQGDLLFLNDIAYEVLHINARGGFLIKFVDESGAETPPIRVRTYGKLEK